MIVPALVAASQAIASQPNQPEIVITASRIAEEQSESAASVEIVDRERLQRLGEPLAVSALRLTPSASVEAGGPAGTLAQVRIRGAEANHTLFFIDGIRANDPAAGDIPRFELLNADIASRIEVVRGPQSALWGSDAIGGVVAVNGVEASSSGYAGSIEAGSFGFRRGSTSGSIADQGLNIAAAAGWQSANGIDSFDGTGDRDGYRNLSGRVRASWEVAPRVELGSAAFSLSGRSEFDGFDPLTFVHSDTLDSTRNRLSAGRLWLSGGNPDRGFSGTLSTSLLGSSNRNFLDQLEINRTTGRRWTAAAQLQYRFATGDVRHTAILALDHDREQFRARDTNYFGASEQARSRSHEAITAEWRTEIAPIVADLALRRDSFSAFADSTTVRASALVDIGGGFSLAGSWSEGIAQPTFFDLYGVFPRSFVGNPGLKPESSRGFEGSIRYRHGPLEAALTAYRQNLEDEIVDLYDPQTFLSTTVNRTSTSHRSGIEAELDWSVGERLRLTANYAYLNATQPGAIPEARLREVRRPRHSASVALDGRSGHFTYGASLAYVGAREDTNFDVFPARPVRLGNYWLAGARVAYALSPEFELFARGSNLLDERYQDVFGYRTEGRAAYIGIRLSGG